MTDDLRRGDQTSDWEVSWEARSLDLLKTTLKATPAQRLEWLEEAILIAYEAGAIARADELDARGKRRGSA